MRDNTHLGKAIATLGIWLIAGGIGITALLTSTVTADHEMVAVVALIVAFVATRSIWNEPKDKNRKFGKAKRGDNNSDKLSLLLELMSEEEREAFKESLKRQYTADFSQDGEIPYDYYEDESIDYERR